MKHKKQEASQLLVCWDEVLPFTTGESSHSTSRLSVASAEEQSQIMTVGRFRSQLVAIKRLHDDSTRDDTRVLTELEIVRSIMVCTQD